jgi:Activator of Hsp90 ATPase homolog 1-like protein
MRPVLVSGGLIRSLAFRKENPMFIQALIYTSFLLCAVGLTTEQLQAPGRSFRIEIAANGTPSEVFKLWTTEAGVKKWFAPGARIEARVGGRYEIIFDPVTDADGSVRGTKGARV